MLNFNIMNEVYTPITYNVFYLRFIKNPISKGIAIFDCSGNKIKYKIPIKSYNDFGKYQSHIGGYKSVNLLINKYNLDKMVFIFNSEKDYMARRYYITDVWKLNIEYKTIDDIGNIYLYCTKDSLTTD